jgi:sulfatase modifying factor 1
MASNSGGSTTSPPAVFTTAGEQLPPSATTYAASLIMSNYAELNGIVNPNGVDTHTFFEWGTNTSYGQVVGGGDTGHGETTIGQVYGLGGLTPNTTYHYQIFASNDLGMVTYGGDTNFTTALAGPPAGMVLIPGGSFIIGDTLDGESDAIPTNVNVSAFYMDTNLVSLSQWQTVYNWAVLQGYIFGTGIGATAANNPVQTISWEDAVQWCNARSQQSGLTPVYYTDQAFTGVLGANGNYGDTVYANWAANGYRLPTEAEWERAARGGTNGLRFPWGDYIIDAAPPSGVANYYSNGDSVPSGGYDYGSVAYPPSFAGPNPAAYYIGEPLPWTTAVGLFAPNAYGLCDMAGNLQEWCWDWYAGPPYPTGSPYLGGTDPRGPASSTGSHVTRGGSWDDPAYNLRCANRIFYMTATGDLYIGFRCVKGP